MRRLEERIRDLERLLGRKTLEIEILREGAGEVGVKKTELAALVAAEGRFPMKAVAETLGVARSNLHDKVRRASKPLQRETGSCSCGLGERAVLRSKRNLSIDARVTIE